LGWMAKTTLPGQIFFWLYGTDHDYFQRESFAFRAGELSANNFLIAGAFRSRHVYVVGAVGRTPHVGAKLQPQERAWHEVTVWRQREWEWNERHSGTGSSLKVRYIWMPWCREMHIVGWHAPLSTTMRNSQHACRKETCQESNLAALDSTTVSQTAGIFRGGHRKGFCRTATFANTGVTGRVSTADGT
jgi:hypothetical protein